MGQASPEARALAGLAADVGYLALLALLIFAAVDRRAPPQDLPWKPFSFDRPIGWATAGQLARALSRPEGCQVLLADAGIDFQPVPDRRSGYCAVQDAGRLGPAAAPFAPSRPLMTCQLAATSALWARQVAAPAAEAIFGAELERIEHYGTYACRRIYGRAEGRVSQHATADAVDVAAFRLSDGRRISVRADWSGSGAKAEFLRQVRDDGCRLFRAVLSPDYNAAHADHLHLDVGPYRLCR